VLPFLTASSQRRFSTTARFRSEQPEALLAGLSWAWSRLGRWLDYRFDCDSSGLSAVEGPCPVKTVNSARSVAQILAVLVDHLEALP
jgi:hypothetical protein